MKLCILRFLLLVLFLACKTSSFAYETFEVDGISYQTINENEVKVMRNTKYKGDIVIPSEIYFDGNTYKVTEINERAFGACAIKSIQFPYGLKKIGHTSFYDCMLLKTITIPNSVTTIGSQAFANCISLESIELPESLINIGGYCFEECRSLSSIVIPNSIKTINSSTFKGCSSLSEIIIGTSVSTIGSNAFEGCTNLQNMTIPSSVTKIYSDAFNGCKIFQSLNFEEGSDDLDIWEGTLIGAQEMYLGRNVKGNFARLGCYGLFRGLERLTISTCVTEIPRGLFAFAVQLKRLVIPNSVKEIGHYAFYESKIDTLIIGNSVTKIEREAFNCYYKDVICLNPIPPTIENYSFAVNYNATLKVPKGCVEAYKNAKYDHYFLNIAEFDTSDIDNIIVDAPNQYASVYDIQGVRMPVKASDLDRLSKGIYIVNGKKYIAK